MASKGTWEVMTGPLGLGTRCPQGKKHEPCAVERGGVSMCVCLRGGVSSGGTWGHSTSRRLIQTRAPSLCLNFFTCKMEAIKYPPLGLLSMREGQAYKEGRLAGPREGGSVGTCVYVRCSNVGEWVSLCLSGWYVCVCCLCEGLSM